MNDKFALVDLATDITIAWLANPSTKVEVDDVPAFLASVFNAVVSLDKAVTTGDELSSNEGQIHKPAVSVRHSLASPDHIISLIDGKPYKTLARHLSRHGLTPAAYRIRYGLKQDYPMTAPTFSAARREMAKRIGLGRTPAAKKPENAQAVAPSKRRKLGIATK